MQKTTQNKEDYLWDRSPVQGIGHHQHVWALLPVPHGLSEVTTIPFMGIIVLFLLSIHLSRHPQLYRIAFFLFLFCFPTVFGQLHTIYSFVSGSLARYCVSVGSISKLCVAVLHSLRLLCDIASCDHNTDDGSIILMSILAVSRWENGIGCCSETDFEVDLLSQECAIYFSVVADENYHCSAFLLTLGLSIFLLGQWRS